MKKLCVLFSLIISSAFGIDNIVNFTGVNKVDFVNPFTGNHTVVVTPINYATFSSAPNTNYAPSYTVGNNQVSYEASSLSEDVAPVNWIQSQFANEGIIYSLANQISSISISPNKLEFALKGNLSFQSSGSNFICNNILLGKRSDNNAQTWWLFPNIDQTQLPQYQRMNDSLLIQCTNSTITSNPTSWFYVSAKNNNTFDIQAVGTENKVCFQGIKLKDFVTNNIYVTPNEKYENFIKVDNSNNCLSIYANLKNSTDVVKQAKNWFGNSIDWAAYNMTTRGTNEDVGGYTPDELNFIFQGNMTFNYKGVEYTCNNLMFGQGHNGLIYNWWGFANANDFDFNLQVAPNNYVIGCSSLASDHLFIKHTSKDNVFEITDQGNLLRN